MEFQYFSRHTKRPTTTKESGTKRAESGVIYQIDCKECDKEYSGGTGRQLEAMKKEHQADVRYKRIENTALAEDSAMTGHKIHWKNAQIVLEMEEDWHRKKTKEFWNIKWMKPG